MFLRCPHCYHCHHFVHRVGRCVDFFGDLDGYLLESTCGISLSYRLLLAPLVRPIHALRIPRSFHYARHVQRVRY